MNFEALIAIINNSKNNDSTTNNSTTNNSTNNNSSNIRRVPISQDIQNELESHYKNILKNFLDEKDKVEFDGNYKCEDDEIYELEDFDWEKKIKNCDLTKEDFKNIITLNIISNDDFEKIKILIVSQIVSQDNYLIFQSMDNRKFIKPKSFLFYSNNTLNYEDKKGIKIDGNIDCIIELNSKRLFFTSFHNASKIFDLSDYYREATKTEINEFFSNEIFDGKIESDNLTSNIRKKIFLILKNETLQKVNKNFQQVKNYAEELGIDCFKKDKIELPKDNKKLKEIINFLNEDLYKSPISNAIYESNSKKMIK
ncbi:MAG: Uncharacterized protein XD76_0249 [candidate division TA06 bacterium 32_111]|uniref:DUF4868 domain-containing protein n=2 Tax=Bacteria candidate phyla TaxID=1783234 RepID=A0A101I3T4_UNCT6|nr:MAG: Uncharacterized protein XD76_0249 [candidate division TA06 bacterium 32_111]KUK87718.1 MAG: Uncharacterized protein XE03_0609 [candidate division TA06 bacterium 34_109]HAF07555.1 hypothetical protein [candidate division WOR-3 bacterium]HCP17624.1 hypothetical protein [candidate division WOR-3 bacterium]